MHYLTLDTNTWIYLANGTEPVKLLHYIKEEVERDNITILLPQIVVTEWNKNKDKAVKQGVLKHYSEINESLERILKLLGDKGERDVFSFLLPDDYKKDHFKDVIEKFKGKKKDIEDAINNNIKLIDELFLHKNTRVINIDNETYLKAGEFAIEKKAPFKTKNSFADALIVFSFIKFVEQSAIEGALFITYNTEDFCEKKDCKKFLHSDLKPDFLRTKSNFFTIVGEALNTIKENIVSEDELEFIKEQQEWGDIDDDIEYCEVCDDNGYNNEIYFNEEELIDERKIDPISVNQLEFGFAKDMPRTPVRLRYEKIEIGHCSWCSTEYFKCVECGELNEVLPIDYNKRIECHGCGLHYFIDHFMDTDYLEEKTYKILSPKEICQKCGEEFEPDGSGTNICTKCEEEYSFD